MRWHDAAVIVGSLVLAGVGVAISEMQPTQPSEVPQRWERVHPDLERVRVPGGWLYRPTYGVALCFVPDNVKEF